jgi:DNA polymerase-3 subunit gamma/tau
VVEGDRARAQPLAQKLSMPALARTWQMLLKGLGEVQTAPSPLQAAEMVLVRLAYVADLPPPAEVIRILAEQRDVGGTSPRAAGPAGPGNSVTATATRTIAGDGTGSSGARLALAAQPETVPVEAETPLPAPQLSAPQLPAPQNFRDIVDLFEKNREAMLRSHLMAHCHLVRFEVGRIELRLAAGAPRDLPNRLGQLLGEWTGQRWVVSVSSEAGEPTLAEQEERRVRDLREQAAEHPMVRAVLETFPGAVIEAVRELAPLDPGGDAAAESDEISDGEELA